MAIDTATTNVERREPTVNRNCCQNIRSLVTIIARGLAIPIKTVPIESANITDARRGSCDILATGKADAQNIRAITTLRRKLRVHAVLKWSTVGFRCCTSAEFSDKSVTELMIAKMVVANATKPKSAGVRKRARTIVLINPREFVTTPAALIQTVPLAIFPRTPSKASSKNCDQCWIN